MKLIKYLIWFLFGVLLFYILNNRYYRLQENFTIGGPIIRILQDNNTHNYSFLYGDNPIPDDKTLVDDKVYDFSEFEKEHPGGAKVLIYYRGKDASVKFHKIKQHTDKIKESLVNFQVGILVI